MTVTAIAVLTAYLSQTEVSGLGTMSSHQNIAMEFSRVNLDSFQLLLVLSSGVAIPLVLDFVFDLSHGLMMKSQRRIEVVFPKFVLVSSLLVPNLLILFVSLPRQKTEQFFYFHLSKLLFLFYGVYGHLWITGGTFFQSISILTSYSCMCAGVVVCTWDMNSYHQFTFLYWIAFVLFVLGFLLFFIQSYIWMILLRSNGFQNISLSQMSCLTCIVLYALFGTSSVFCLLSTRGRFNESSTMACICLETGFVLLFVFIQSRMIHLEFHEKEVSEHRLSELHLYYTLAESLNTSSLDMSCAFESSFYNHAGVYFY